MRATDDARVSAAEQLRLAHEDAVSRKLSLGQHHLTVSLIADSQDELAQLSSDLDTAGAQNQTYFVKDRLVAKAHYFAQWPGNRSHRVRTSLVTNVNVADFASMHRSGRGKAADQVPWGITGRGVSNR